MFDGAGCRQKLPLVFGYVPANQVPIPCAFAQRTSEHNVDASISLPLGYHIDTICSHYDNSKVNDVMTFDST